MLYEQGLATKEKQEQKHRAILEEKENKFNTVFTKDHTNRIIEKAKI
jgi:hypothetical protein